MLNIMVVGVGKMGTLLMQNIEQSDDLALGAVFDGFTTPDLTNVKDIHAIVDFSHPNNLAWIAPYVKEHHVPYICGTTGHSDEQKAIIESLSAYAPIVFQYNFSLGIAVFQEVLKMMTPMLKENFDIDVIGTHHIQKQDAPSGTAKMLVAAMNPDGEYEEVHGRNGFVGKRGKEIGIHAIRGGSVAGEHTVCFLGADEAIEIKHSATSKQIFITGALRAVRFVQNQPYGSYTMKDILFNK